VVGFGVWVVAVASLAYAGWTLWYVIKDRVPRERHVVGAGVVEMLLIIQAVVAIVLWIVDAGPKGGSAVFIGYLLFVLILLPAALFVALAEKSRWGTAILATAALIIPVLDVRLQQVWDGV
jgi:hypothetical protein